MNQLFFPAYSRRVKFAVVHGVPHYRPAPIVGDWLTMKSLPEMTQAERDRYLYGFLARWKNHPNPKVEREEAEDDDRYKGFRS